MSIYDEMSTMRKDIDDLKHQQEALRRAVALLLKKQQEQQKEVEHDGE
ncbi:hypothetical protein LCGC14_0637620 [marine sediment metagenome]|uniref:Uncharacterized protein n=1 Tax=marine sediment metagenome TaxID=412755 RepID=A0A0F9TLL1_9ZZZZ